MKEKHLDLALEVVLLALLVIVSLIFDRRLGIVFSGTKSMCLRLSMLVLLGLWTLKLFVFSGRNFKRSPLDWQVLSYLICVVAATFNSVQVYVSAFGAYGRYEGLGSLLIYGLLFFAAVNFLKTVPQIKRMLLVIIICAALMSVYGIIQRMAIDPYAWGGVPTQERVIGTIGQPNFLAAYLIMAFMLGLSLLFSFKPEKQKWNLEIVSSQAIYFLTYLFVFLFFVIMLYSQNLDSVRNPLGWYLAFSILVSALVWLSWNLPNFKKPVFETMLLLCLFLIYIGILYTQSRGGVVGFLGGAAFLAFYLPRQLWFENWRKLLILGSLIFVVSGYIFLNPAISPLARVAGEVKVEEKGPEAQLEFTGAVGSRFETWKSSFEIIADYPVFGIGPEVMKMIFPRYETDQFRFYEGFHVKQDRSHNETLDMSVTRGVITLLVYLWLLISLFYLGILKFKSLPLETAVLTAGLLAAILAYLFQNQFSFGVVAITAPFWVMLGCVAGILAAKEEKAQIAFNPNWWLFSLCVLILLGGFYLSPFQYRADIYFKEGKMLAGAGNFERAIYDYKKSIEICPYEGSGYTHLGIAYINMYNLSRQPDWLNKALAAFKEGEVFDAYNADNFYLRGKSALYLRQYSLARSETLIAVRIDPYYAEAYQTLGDLDKLEGKPAQAAQMYEKAFVINPTLGVLLDELIKIQGTDSSSLIKIMEKLVETYPKNPVLLEKAGNLYLEKNSLSRAQEIFARLLKLNNQSLAAYVGLGMVLTEKGKFPQAFENFQNALFLDPRNVNIHNGLGYYYYRTNEIAQAREHFKIVLLYDSHNLFAHEMLKKLR